MHSEDLGTYKVQLQQLTNSILQTRKLLASLSDRMIDIRALQMDEVFVCI